MRTQLPSSSRQPMPCTSISIGVPMGPLGAPTTFAVMSRSNAVCVNRLSPCCTTTSCTNPKSSGATKVAATRPAASLLTVAIRYAAGVNSRPKYSAIVTFQEPFTVRQTSSSSCSGGKFSPVTVSGVPTGPCAGETFRCPTYPFDGSVNATSAPSSLARGAASALWLTAHKLGANKTVNNMQASPQARPPSMRIEGGRAWGLACMLLTVLFAPSLCAVSQSALAAPRASELGAEVALTEPSNGYVGHLKVSPAHGPV